MKACDYCGRKNPDKLVFCSECGTALGMAEPVPRNTSRDTVDFFSRPVPSWIKWGTWLSSWAVVSVAIMVGHPKALYLACAFPVGFCGLLPWMGPLTLIAAGPVTVAGWIVYVQLTSWMRSSRWGKFSFCYLLFCVFLVFNVVGCRRLLAFTGMNH